MILRCSSFSLHMFSPPRVAFPRVCVYSMNAFDLINLVGFATMNRMFQKHQDQKEAALTQISSRLPLHDIMTITTDLLQQTPNIQFRVHEAAFKIKIVQHTEAGDIFAFTQVYEMTPTLHMLVMRRERGPIADYNVLFSSFKARFREREQHAEDHT
jgi:hypothetical protein